MSKPVRPQRPRVPRIIKPLTKPLLGIRLQLYRSYLFLSNPYPTACLVSKSVPSSAHKKKQVLWRTG